ncbi:MAG: winged helix-turn-helix domain-containing protein [Terriglobales bacterium]
MSSPPGVTRGRAKTLAEARYVQFGPNCLDLRRSTLRRHPTDVRLPERVLALLCALLERPGKLISNGELTATVWSGRSPDSGDIALNQLFRRLRMLLGDNAPSERYLRRVPGRGAIWEAPVTFECEEATCTG